MEIRSSHLSNYFRNVPNSESSFQMQGGGDEEWWGRLHEPSTAAKFETGDAEDESVGEKGEGLEGGGKLFINSGIL